MRLSQTARKLNVGTQTIVQYLATQGVQIPSNPNLKLSPEQLALLEKEFSSALKEKKKAESIILDLTKKQKKEEASPENQLPSKKKIATPDKQEKKPTLDPTLTTPKQIPLPPQSKQHVKGITMLGKVDLNKTFKNKEKKEPVKKYTKQPVTSYAPAPKYIKPKPFSSRRTPPHLAEKKTKEYFQEINKAHVPKAKRSKYQKAKKERLIKAKEIEQQEARQEEKILRVTEFITANELAALVKLPITKFLATCMDLGIIASINQRLDPETIIIVAHELGFEVKFVKSQEKEQQLDQPQDLIHRPPIVTVMGHVDHGKTSLLDYIRKAQVVATEAGSITQHIGAYQVQTKEKKSIVFLDTPGHEAFTAMRARGAQLTDIAIIIIAADDGVMPQTKEAISHAQLAETPIIIAINKIDKPGANPQKIKEELSQLNIIVEDWGGKYQCQEISAKKGIGIDELLEKILLEAEMLALTANPNKKAKGIVIEASLDQGRGYLSTLIVQGGTLKKGDIIVAGPYFGKVKTMFNAKGTPLTHTTPSMPAQVLGLNGAPKAGQPFIVVTSKQAARDLAASNEKMLREQRFLVQHTTSIEQVRKALEEKSIPEVNILIKGDVDGSIEALADALLKLSTDEINVKIIYKAVGHISESDVILAVASRAIIVGFQTKFTPKARIMANSEKVDVQLHSIIYDAIDYIQKVIENILTPQEEKEIIIGKAEVIKTFTFPAVGTIAGCKVLKGTISKDAILRCTRKNKILHTGPIRELQHKGKPIAQAKSRSECGINFENFNDILVGDIIEQVQA